jgi:spore coat polysaccharide biosynthesis protein SpsF (cytidylyltransferase family)
MNAQPGIILQARIASTRLYAKALAPVGGRLILHRCITRLMSSGVGRVILATSDLPEDDVLALLASRLGAWVFRGDAHDVLGRMAAAAEAYHVDPVIRATADNPAVDHAAPRRLLAVMQRNGVDYAREEGLPLGAGVEGITAAALRASSRMAYRAYDREHVTTYIRANASHRMAVLAAPASLMAPSLRLTVDTPDDLTWIRELFFRSGVEDPTVRELIAAARQVRTEAA